VRIVVALGGNALLERGEAPLAEVQQRHVTAGVAALVPLLKRHDVVITHGNGPQVGLLALESARDPDLSAPYPFDVLDAQTQGMIGYLIAQAVRNARPDREVVCLISQALVAADDPAFREPTKFVGPAYEEEEARALAARFGWRLGEDGGRLRRVVPSPEPMAIVEMAVIRALLAAGTLVVCAGGGGIPVTAGPDGSLHGAEAVVDKDLTASLVARELGADALMLLTDVPAVELGFGSTEPLAVRRSSPEALRCHRFPPGSMGPKVEAACRFAEATGHPAVIGRLADAASMLAGAAGTYVVPGAELVTAPVRAGTGAPCAPAEGQGRGTGAQPAGHTGGSHP
jgi:carbamate kinase